MSDFIGTKTRLACGLTKPLALNEFRGAFWEGTSTPPRVIFVISVPRSGSSLTQQYLGDHPSLIRARMSPSHNWWDAWVTQRVSYPLGRSVLDKRTKYIDHLSKIIGAFNRHVSILLLVRDPRDVLLSLRNAEKRSYGLHYNYPRDGSFFSVWSDKYREAIGVLKDWNQPDRHRLLRYEDLVNNPLTVKEDFCRWIGIEPERISRDYTPAVNKRFFNMLGFKPGSDRRAIETKEISTDSLQSWKNKSANGHLDAWQNYEETWELMTKLGYLESTRSHEDNSSNSIRDISSL